MIENWKEIEEKEFVNFKKECVRKHEILDPFDSDWFKKINLENMEDEKYLLGIIGYLTTEKSYEIAEEIKKDMENKYKKRTIKNLEDLYNFCYESNLIIKYDFIDIVCNCLDANGYSSISFPLGEKEEINITFKLVNAAAFENNITDEKKVNDYDIIIKNITFEIL